jgi:putative FmdB family regulatory protein
LGFPCQQGEGKGIGGAAVRLGKDLDFGGSEEYSVRPAGGKDRERTGRKMPIYEYQCSGCNQRKEILQRLNEKKKPRCDECGGSMKRVISPSAFILKGSGWYVTDYPSESRKKGMESEKKRGEKKKDSSSEKKSAAKDKSTSPAPAARKTRKKTSSSR